MSKRSFWDIERLEENKAPGIQPRGLFMSYSHAVAEELWREQTTPIPNPGAYALLEKDAFLVQCVALTYRKFASDA